MDVARLIWTPMQCVWGITDPCQVNVPGDWDNYKSKIGLKKSNQRNSGNLEDNTKAALKYLVRKGFGASGQPAGNRPAGYFDGWETALERYNRGPLFTEDGRRASSEYAKRVINRAENPDKYIPIEFKKIRKR